MDKAQAIQWFWGNFGLDAYDENTVPDDAEMPYITYSVSTGALENILSLSGSIWYHSNSWEEVTHKADEIASSVGAYGHKIIKIDKGYLLLAQGTPFSSRMGDPDDSSIRRIVINLQAEFLTAY